jgi:hypothetical protein
MESDAAGELGTALRKLEAVCLVNKLFASNLQNRILLELAPFGIDTIERYYSLDHDHRATYLVEVLGKDPVEQILRDVVKETREQARVGRTTSMSNELSRLYADCEPAVRLFRLMHQSYANILERRPDELRGAIGDVNTFLFSELRHTMIAAFTPEDTYALCAFVSALTDKLPTLLEELAVQE